MVHSSPTLLKLPETQSKLIFIIHGWVISVDIAIFLIYTLFFHSCALLSSTPKTETITQCSPLYTNISHTSSPHISRTSLLLFFLHTVDQPPPKPHTKWQKRPKPKRIIKKTIWRQILSPAVRSTSTK